MPSHEQNLELFQVLDKAQCRISELKANPDAHACELKHWEETAEKAKEQLILANQGLVASIARKYEHTGLDAEDLVSEGTKGLIKAIAKFDCRLGNQLSTYATWWIRQAISRAPMMQSVIRIPVGCRTEIRKVKDVEERLSKEHRCEATAEDIAWEMNLPVSKVRALLAASGHSFVSMDAPLGDADGVTYGDVIEDKSAHDPSEAADRASMLELVGEAAETLVGLEREIFLMFRDGPRLSLEETGKTFSLSGERIRQIKVAAFEKVRAYIKAKDRKGPVQAFKTVPAKNGKLQPAPAVAGKTAPPVVKPKVYRLKLRAMEKNPNHHITNNNGTWYCKFTLELVAGGKSQVRNSLHTNNVEDARKRRDKLILLYNGLSGSSAA